MEDNKIKIVGDIGINHNGDINKAERLIAIAKAAGFDYVKFQKRNPELCVPDSKRNEPKVVPWKDNPITYLQYKKDIEFNRDEYDYLKEVAERKYNIKMFSSVWDIDSLKLLAERDEIIKIPSAMLTNDELLKETRKIAKEKGIKTILSTGMSMENEIEKAVKILDPEVILHANSVYPSPIDSLFLNYIEHLREKFPNKKIGYSGHEFGIITTILTMGIKVNWIERHICESNEDWGSDQKASVEPVGMFKLVKYIRDCEKALSIPKQDRFLLKGEDIKRKSLRGN